MTTLYPAGRPAPPSAVPRRQPGRRRAGTRPFPAPACRRCRCRPHGAGKCPTPGAPRTSRRHRSTRPPPPRSAACYPYVAGSGTPAVGTPVGRHQLWGEVVCLDPLAWLRAGLITNPGEFVLGQPGIGKSTLVKRQITGAVATGTRAIILGDTKPDYTMLTEHLGGQVIRIGRGMDRINPLDAGPLGAALRRMSGPDAQALRWEVRSRRLSLLMALCTLVRESRITNAEEVILGRAIDLLDERNQPGGQPTVTDVLTVIEEGPDTLRSAARADTPAGFRDRAADLVFTLDLLATGSLAGVFDQPTSRPIDLDAPRRQRGYLPGRRSRRQAADRRDAVRLGYGFAMVDAAAALADQQIAPRRSYLGGDGRAVAGAARRPRPGRVRRQPDPAQPGQGHGHDHDHPLPRRPGRPGDRGGPRESPRVR